MREGRLKLLDDRGPGKRVLLRLRGIATDHVAPVLDHDLLDLEVVCHLVKAARPRPSMLMLMPRALSTPVKASEVN